MAGRPALRIGQHGEVKRIYRLFNLKRAGSLLILFGVSND